MKLSFSFFSSSAMGRLHKACRKAGLTWYSMWNSCKAAGLFVPEISTLYLYSVTSRMKLSSSSKGPLFYKQLKMLTSHYFIFFHKSKSSLKFSRSMPQSIFCCMSSEEGIQSLHCFITTPLSVFFSFQCSLYCCTKYEEVRRDGNANRKHPCCLNPGSLFSSSFLTLCSEYRKSLSMGSLISQEYLFHLETSSD